MDRWKFGIVFRMLAIIDVTTILPNSSRKIDMKLLLKTSLLTAIAQLTAIPLYF